MEQQRNEADLIIGSLLSARHPAREIDEINLQQVASRNNAGRWSTEQHQMYLDLSEKYRKNYKKIAQSIGTRTAEQVISHEQKYLNRKNRLQKKDQQKLKALKEIKASKGRIETRSISKKRKKRNRSVNEKQAERQQRNPSQKQVKNQKEKNEKDPLEIQAEKQPQPQTQHQIGKGQNSFKKLEMSNQKVIKKSTYKRKHKVKILRNTLIIKPNTESAHQTLNNNRINTRSQFSSNQRQRQND